MEPYLRPEEFSRAEELIYQAKFNEAINNISHLEKDIKDGSIKQLWVLILKGRIYCYIERYKEAIEIGTIAYQLSQKMELAFESVEALIIKTYVIYLGKIEEADRFISEADRIITSYIDDLTIEYSRQLSDILLLKSEICCFTGEIIEAFRFAKKCLDIRQNLNKKIDLSNIYYLLGKLSLYESDSKSGLEYALKSLSLQEELNNQTGIAKSLGLVGTSYYTKGEFEKALKFGRHCLRTPEIGILTKLESLDLLASIYISKGQLGRAIRFRRKLIQIAQREEFQDHLIQGSYGMGVIYKMKGEFEEAMNYLKTSLCISEKFNSSYGIQASLFHLILISIEMKSIDQAKTYLEKMEKFADKTGSRVFKNVFLISKAIVLKNSGRIRNLTEAEEMFIKILETIETPNIRKLALINLCEIYLDEIKYTNNTEILDDIRPLIHKIYKTAEKQNAYPLLAETILLQAKLALIQMDGEEAKRLLIQAQRVAELHGLTLLALKISNEHDNLLEQMDDWNKLKNAPISDRIKLASLNGVVDRMQGKSTIELSILKPEIPILLLIIGEGGFPLFFNQFEKNSKFEEDLISGFLTAFNTFSGELFSKGLDCVKFGNYMLLMQTVNNFSICYLYKGQTYNARHKLSLFTSSIKNNSSIWETLEVFYNTSRVVKLEELPSLKSLISNIFIR